jgi:hypothetical protein
MFAALTAHNLGATVYVLDLDQRLNAFEVATINLPSSCKLWLFFF